MLFQNTDGIAILDWSNKKQQRCHTAPRTTTGALCFSSAECHLWKDTSPSLAHGSRKGRGGVEGLLA